MIGRELGRIKVLSRVVDSPEMSRTLPAILNASPQQVQRRLRTIRIDGASALRHKARGRPLGTRIRDGVCELALALVRASYAFPIYACVMSVALCAGLRTRHAVAH